MKRMLIIKAVFSSVLCLSACKPVATESSLAAEVDAKRKPKNYDVVYYGETSDGEKVYVKETVHASAIDVVGVANRHVENGSKRHYNNRRKISADSYKGGRYFPIGRNGYNTVPDLNPYSNDTSNLREYTVKGAIVSDGEYWRAKNITEGYSSREEGGIPSGNDFGIRVGTNNPTAGLIGEPPPRNLLQEADFNIRGDAADLPPANPETLSSAFQKFLERNRQR